MVKKTAKKSSIKKVVRKAPVKKVSSKKSFAKKTTKKSVSKKKATPKAKPVTKAKGKSVKSKKCSKTWSIVGLLVNIIVIPGLGTLIGGGRSRRNSGIVQLVLSLISYLLIFTMVGAIIGFPLILAMWIWSIVDMARAVMEN